MTIPPDALPPSARQHGPMSIEVPQRPYAINYRAAEDARFWMAICQMEQGENETAAENFAAYLRGYGARNGVWTVQAALLRGLVLGRQQKYALAVQTVNQVIRALPESDIRRSALELFAARWRASRNAGQPADGKTNKASDQSESKAPAPKPQPAASSDKPATKAADGKKK